MKKLLLVLLTTGMFSLATKAQDAPTQKPLAAAPAKMSKEEKQKMMQKKEEEMKAELVAVGATPEQIAKVKEATLAIKQKEKAVKEDASISEDEKKLKGKELKEAQKAKLIEILGVEKAKQFAENRKKAKKDAPKDGPKD